MSRLPMIEALKKYVMRDNISFHMPGHTKGRGFETTDLGKEFIDDIMKFDLTEVQGLDNFHNPEGIIKESQQLLSDLYGSRKSYFLVNGSTSGNLIMIFSSFNEGDKIIVERNCHKSIMNAIILRKLKPVYVKNKVVNEYNAPLSIDMEHFLHVIDANKDAAGVILTYPNYYGVCFNLSMISDKTKQYGMRLLVDAAHGAHFVSCDKLPQNPMDYQVDMVVMSAHKTLPSLTQTAFLHVGNNMDLKEVDFYVNSFLSTSPSYLFLASLDYARYYLQEYGEADYNRSIATANKFREKLNELDYIHVLGQDDINKLYEYGIKEIDLTRYVINIKAKYSASAIEKYLYNNGITVEMNDGSNLVLILTPFNSEDDFNKLYNLLKEINIKRIERNNYKVKDLEIPKLYMSPYQVIEKESKEVNIEYSTGKVCAKSVVPYPPGVPIILPGEIIEKDTIDMIKYYLEQEHTLLGINNGKISVLD